MNLEDRVEIYNYCNVLFQKHEQENKDCIFIENYFGDEVMKTAGKKYGFSIQEVEEIYADVQHIFMEYAANKLLNINSK